MAHIGLMENHILAIAFSDVELFSNLEFSQAFYDAFKESNRDSGWKLVFLCKISWLMSNK